jgi:hypothetical protein
VIAAEYRDAEAMLAALRAVPGRVRDACTPVPVDGVDELLGARPSWIPWITAIGAAIGAIGAYALEWYLVAYLDPLSLGQRAPHLPLPFLIIAVEMGFLCGAIAAFVAFVAGSDLFKLWDPRFEIAGFESVTRDGYWLIADDVDEDALRATAPARVVRVS